MPCMATSSGRTMSEGSIPQDAAAGRVDAAAIAERPGLVKLVAANPSPAPGAEAASGGRSGERAVATETLLKDEVLPTADRCRPGRMRRGWLWLSVYRDHSLPAFSMLMVLESGTCSSRTQKKIPVLKEAQPGVAQDLTLLVPAVPVAM